MRYLTPAFCKTSCISCGKKYDSGIDTTNPMINPFSHADRNVGPKPKFTSTMTNDITSDMQKEVSNAAKIRIFILILLITNLS